MWRSRRLRSTVWRYQHPNDRILGVASVPRVRPDGRYAAPRVLRAVDVQLHAVAAIDDLGDIDRDPAGVDDHAVAFRSRGVKRDLEQVGDFGIGAADDHRLVRLGDLDVTERGENGQRRVLLEGVGIALVDVPGKMQADHRVWLVLTELQAAQEQVVGRRAAVFLAQPRLCRRVPHRDHARHVVPDCRDQGRPGRLELEPPLVANPLGHEGATALLAMNEAFLLQQVDRLANGHPRHLELLLQLLERRDLLARLPLSVLDAPAQCVRQLHVERDAAALVGTCQVRHRAKVLSF